MIKSFGKYSANSFVFVTAMKTVSVNALPVQQSGTSEIWIVGMV